ncbi:hypothetical protein PG989_013608 [Apiospora arundinis]
MDLCKDCRILWAQVLLEARTGSTDTRVGASVDGAWLNARGCPLCNYIHLGVAEALSQQRHLSEADCYVRFYLHVDDASRLAAIELVVINDDETWVMDPIKMTVWASQGTPAAGSGIISTAPPLISDSTQEAMGLYSTWLEGCRLKHKACMKTISGKIVDEEMGPELPTRVLDVGDQATKSIVLLESKGQCANYCALSYCWGPQNAQTFLTTKETLQDRLRGIDFDLLPRTFQDAVQIARSLGIRYLWIDGLCIIQGDKEDWEYEAGRMGAVYEQASLVIAASGSASAQEGCFVVEPRETTPLDLPYFTETGLIQGCVHTSFDYSRTNRSPFDGPLQKRGWALQEAHFARRSIHLMPGGPTWICKESQLDEKFLETELKLNKGWDHVLENYSRRKLTYKSDRLIALQGYAAELLKITKGDIYNRGAFLSGLPGQLLWVVDQSVPESEDIQEIPSWAWASSGAPKTFATNHSQLLPIVGGRQIRIQASGALLIEGRITECHLGDDYDDETSDYTDGSSGLNSSSGGVQGMRDFISTWTSQPMFGLANTNDPQSKSFRGLAVFDREHHASIYFLPLMGTMLWGHLIFNLDARVPLAPTTNYEDYIGLLLVKSCSQNATYRRVGVGFVRITPQYFHELLSEEIRIT